MCERQERVSPCECWDLVCVYVCMCVCVPVGKVVEKRLGLDRDPEVTGREF